MFKRIDENVLLFNPRLIKQKEYWAVKLSGDIPVMEIRGDNNRGDRWPRAGREETRMVFPADLCRRLVTFGKNSDLSLYIVLLTGLKLLVYRYTGSEDTGILSPLHSSTISDLTMNHCVLIRDTVPESLPFIRMVLQVRESVLDAYNNQDYPFDKLAAELFEDSPGRPGAALPNISFSLTNIHSRGNIDALNGKLAFVLSRENETITVNLSYDADTYGKDFADCFLSHLAAILEHAFEDIEKRISNISFLSPEDRKRLLFDFNDTRSDYSRDKTILQLFEAQVEKAPWNIALVGRGTDGPYMRYESYGQLNKKACRMARVLRAKGVGAHDITALLMENSIEMVTAILAVLKAGAAYLPMDPEIPGERKKYMLADSGVRLVLTDTPADVVLPGGPDDIPGETETGISPKPSEPAYVIYTSGSTGKPKGVVVEHGSLVNLCCWHNEDFSVTSRDRGTRYANPGFDASVWEIFPYLIAGASLYIVDDDIKLDLDELNRYFERHQVTISFLPTQVGEQFTKCENRSLRVLLTGGDKLKEFIKRDYRLVNNYGPTENTVVSTSCTVKDNYRNIPIGRPISNNRVFILDKNLEPLPVGATGELCLSGDSLARGYLNRP